MRPPAGTVPPSTTKPSPFAELGLDPKTATVEAVRERQRQLAKIWHADVSHSEAAEARLKQVNEAAADCIRILRTHQGP